MPTTYGGKSLEAVSDWMQLSPADQLAAAPALARAFADPATETRLFNVLKLYARSREAALAGRPFWSRLCDPVVLESFVPSPSQRVVQELVHLCLKTSHTTVVDALFSAVSQRRWPHVSVTPSLVKHAMLACRGGRSDHITHLYNTYFVRGGMPLDSSIVSLLLDAFATSRPIAMREAASVFDMVLSGELTAPPLLAREMTFHLGKLLTACGRPSPPLVNEGLALFNAVAGAGKDSPVRLSNVAVSCAMSLMLKDSPPRVHAAEALFNRMASGKLGPSVVPSESTVTLLIRVHNLKHPPDVASITAVLGDMCCGQWGLQPNAITACAALDGYILASPPAIREVSAVFDMFIQGRIPVPQSEIRIIDIQLSRALTACAAHSPPLVDEGLALFNRVAAAGPACPVQHTTYSVSCALSLLLRALPPRIPEAKALFQQLSDGRFGPDVLPTAVTVNTLLDCFAKQSPPHVADITALFNDVCAGKWGFGPNVVLSLTAVEAYTNAVPCAIAEASAVFHRMLSGDIPVPPDLSLKVSAHLHKLLNACVLNDPPLIAEGLILFEQFRSLGPSSPVKVNAGTVRCAIALMLKAVPPRPKHAMRLFTQLSTGAFGEHAVPDVFVVGTLLDGLSKVSPHYLGTMTSLFHDMRSLKWGFPPNYVIANMLLDAATSFPAQSVDLASTVFDCLVTKEIPVPPSEVHAFAVQLSKFLTACAQHVPPLVSEGLRIWDAIMAAGPSCPIKHNTYTINAAMALLVKATPSRMADAEALLAQLAAGAFVAGSKPNIVSVNTLMDGYLKQSPPDVARIASLFDDVCAKRWGFGPDFVTATKALEGCTRTAPVDANRAVAVVRKLLSREIHVPSFVRPRDLTVQVNLLLTACARDVPPPVDAALALFDELLSAGADSPVPIDATTVNSVLFVLLKAAPPRLEEAVALFNRLASGEFGRKVPVDVISANTLLSGYAQLSPPNVTSITSLFNDVCARKWGFPPNIATATAAIAGYRNCVPVAVTEATAVFDMLLSGVIRCPSLHNHSVTSQLNKLLQACAASEPPLVDEGVSLFLKVCSAGSGSRVGIDTATLTTVAALVLAQPVPRPDAAARILAAPAHLLEHRPKDRAVLIDTLQRLTYVVMDADTSAPQPHVQ